MEKALSNLYEDKTLAELMLLLYRQGGIKTIKDFFEPLRYSIRQYKYSSNIIGIKYIDGINHLWRPRWAREARGKHFYVDENNVVILKACLQRGAELMTDIHIKCGQEETQDVKKTNNGFLEFDDQQRSTMKSFLGDSAIEGTLTGKVDGSLLEINVYGQKSSQYPIMVNLLQSMREEDPFQTVLLDWCLKNNLPLYTVSTQTTLFIGKDMQDYFLTAIESILQQQQNEQQNAFSTLLDQNLSNNQNWQNIQPLFSNFMKRLIGSLPESLRSEEVSLHLKFEAVCKNRTTYKNVCHRELAVGYDYSAISFLGLVTVDQGFIPHFDLPSTSSVVPHPVHIPVKQTREVFEIMQALTEVVEGRELKINFMRKYFPQQIQYPLHAEGFVYLDKPILNGLKSSQYNYSKVKLPIYYKMHKIKSQNVESILRLDDKLDNFFLDLKEIRTLAQNLENELLRVLWNLVTKMQNEISKAEASGFYQALKSENAKKRMLDYLQNQNDFNMREIVFRMLSNQCKALYNQMVNEETQKQWNRQSEEHLDFIKTAWSILKPWECMYDNGQLLQRIRTELSKNISSQGQQSQEVSNKKSIFYLAYQALVIEKNKQNEAE